MTDATRRNYLRFAAVGGVLMVVAVVQLVATNDPGSYGGVVGGLMVLIISLSLEWRRRRRSSKDA